MYNFFAVGLVKWLKTCRNMNQLHHACERGDLEEVTSFLRSEECDINACNTDGESPLHIACKKSYLEIVKALQKDHKCDLNIQNSYGDTPLHIACKMKALDIIRFLLEMRCSTNISNKKGETAQDIPLNKDGDCLLHIACQWGDVDIVRYLIIDEGCNPNIQSSTSENTPLHIAINFVQDDMVVQLLSCKECNPNLQNRLSDTPLHTAARLNRTAAISELSAHQMCNINAQNKEGYTPLHIAVLVDGKYTVSHLLATKQCDPNIQNIDSETPLHIAARKVQGETIIGHLLSHEKCNLNVQNKEGDTPLHMACYGRSFTFVKLLLEQKCNTDGRCDLNVQNASLNTPLHLACYRKSLSIIKCLIVMKCSTNIPNKKGETAQDIPLNKNGDCLLHMACRWGDVDILRYLIFKEKCTTNIPNYYWNTPVHIACYMKSLNIIKHFLEMKCSTNIPNDEGMTAQSIPLSGNKDYLLHIACQWGDVDCIKYLVYDQRCDLNIQNAYQDTPLHIACKIKSLTIIKVLLEMKCSTNIPNKKGVTAQNIPLNKDGDCLLHIACQWGDVDIVKYLITYENCNPSIHSSTSENTPLHIAAKYGQEEIIVQLSNKCDLNATNKEGDTPLHIAVRQSETAAISKLLAHQVCNLNIQNKEGDTPLHIAVRQGKTAAISQLLAHQVCHLNIQNKEGDTPLHIAVRQSETATISQLLAHQVCDLNIQNKEGDTPLHIAVRQSETAAISKLLAHQVCDLNIQNKEGDTPLHIAVRQGKTAAISQLLAHQVCHLNIQNKEGDTPLHIAVRQSETATISQLLAHQVCDLNIQNKEGDTPLHIAVRQSETAAVSQLLAHQVCDLNIQNKEGDTPVHIAVRQSARETAAISQLLAHQVCDLNIQNKEGDTPLHIAVRQSARETAAISQLLAHQVCDLNIQNKEGDTPLHIAVRQSARETAAISQLLVHEVCDLNIQNKEGDTPLHIAVRNYATPVISQLLKDRQCSLNIQNNEGDTALHIACHKRSLRIIRLLLEMRCSTNIPNKNGETAQDIPLNEDGDCLLHIACQWGDVDIVRYLIIEERYDLNLQNTHLNTPLHTACYLKSPSIIRLLLEMKCSTNIPNNKGETAQNIQLNEDGDRLIHVACQWGKMNIVDYLIMDEGCDLNIQNLSKNTPLHIAVMYGQVHYTITVQLLSCEECNPDIQNEKGDTPLHIACYWKSLNIIRLLLERRCSTSIPNKKGKTAQNITLNEDGDCLLHIACQWGDVDILRYLIIEEKCDLNARSSMSENTPLHIAVKHEQDGAIVQLLSCEECDLNVQNEDGDTPLQFAVQQSKISTNEQCNSIVLTKEGDTPLHIACNSKSLHIIKLLLERKCSTNIPNKKGETAQDIPLDEDGDCLLHIACQWDNVDIVRHLITDGKCNISIPNFNLNTPLHIACYMGSSTIRLLLEMRCSTNIPNKKGDTAQEIPLNEDGDYLLHIACQWGDVDIVSYLITDEGCNPNIQTSNSKNAPLHIAAKYGQDDIVVQLLSYKECNPNVQNKNGDTTLHIVARNNGTPAISHLLANQQCDPNVLNSDHLTPLLIAIKQNNSSAATALLHHNKCDPTVCDLHGNTPLHLACVGGETQPEMVEVAKQLLTSVDPSCVNNAGQTPIEITTNYQLIQAISHFFKCKKKQSVQTYINMFIVGNPGTGKSTLVKAICKEATSILWKIIPKQMRRVKNVSLHTAGIIPTTFQSKTFGNMVLYDLAGQVEYYTSHAAVIQSAVISTPPAFVVVVNLSESEEKISQTLRYWWSFIDNHAARSSEPPQVILVGSHADIVNSTGGSVQDMMTQMSALLKQLSASFHFAGQVALDCRDPASKELRLFCSLVNQSCTILRQTADVDLHCHVLYAFLLEKFSGKVACTFPDIASSVKENSELLPQNPDSLIPLVSTLSDKGLLLLVKGGESYGDWWIILQKQALLGEINGVIFAPKSFRQHKDLSWSTGVVPFSRLKKEFPYDPNMISEFLVHLEFCFKIEDHETLALLKDETVNLEDTSLDVSEEYYFFPALVSVKNPLHVWEENDDMCCKCGWFYQCIQQDQFLTTQFLHVLILRLAFTFALKLDAGDCRHDALALRRKCSVWKHGIAWLNRVPIETVVEVGLQYQSVIVMMRCPKGKETKCVQLRSEVIQKILEAKDEHCKAVKMSESFIHPTDVKYPFTDNIEDVKFYSLTEIGRGILCKEEANALDHGGRKAIPVQDLLLFDSRNADANPEVLREFFSEKHSMDEIVRRQVLETLNSKSEK